MLVGIWPVCGFVLFATVCFGGVVFLITVLSSFVFGNKVINLRISELN